MQIPVRVLRDALELVRPVVPKRTTLPICKNVLLIDGQVRATNLEVEVTVQLGQETGGPILLPFALGYAFLQHVPGVGILTLTQEKGLVTLESGRTRTVLNALQVIDDFPPVPDLEDQAEVVIDGTMLVKGLMELVYYTATEARRPVLTGICLTLGDPVEVAAADGFKLARLRLNARLPHHEGEQLILPVGTVRLLAHLWKGAGAAPEMGLEGTVADLATAKRLLRLEYNLIGHRARFTMGKVSLTTQLLEGDFPNYRQLIPTDLPQRASFMGGDMWQALKVVKDMARDSSGIVRLSWEGEGMTVKAQTGDVGEVTAQVRLLVPCTQPGTIAIGIKYLTTYFKGQEGIVSMGVKTPSSPALFTTPGMPDVVMMPMFVRPDSKPEAASVQDTGEGEARPEESEGEEPEAAGPAPAEEPKKRRAARKKSGTPG